MLCVPTLISAILVFWNVQSLGLTYWDEYYYTETAKWFLGVSGGWFAIYEPPGFSMAIALFWRLFGVHDFVAIAVSGSFAVLTVALISILGFKYFGVEVGVVAPLLLSFMPFFLYYSRLAVADMALTFFFSAAVLASYAALRSGKHREMLLAGLLMAICTGLKYNGFMAWLIPAFYMPVIAASERSGKRFAVLKRSVKTLLLMIIPTVIGLLSWFYVLGVPTGTSKHFSSHQLIHLISPRILLAGISKFRSVVLTSHSGQLALTPLLSAPFYVQVLSMWVTIPVLLLALLGVMRRTIKEEPEFYVVFWFIAPFLIFSSIPGTFQRAILPLLPPLSLLAAIGLRRVGRAVQIILNAKIKFIPNLHAIVSYSILILILTLTLYPAYHAVADTHAGYRQAGNILNSLPGGMQVYCLCQPVIYFYYQVNFTVTNPTNLPSNGYVVIDFTGYLQGHMTASAIQSLESQVSDGHLKLVASVPLDLPQPLYLDGLSFSQIAELNSTYTYIRIYQIVNGTQVHS